jgi:hypothetical protein
MPQRVAALCFAEFHHSSVFPVTSGRISGCTSVTTTRHAINDFSLNKAERQKYDNYIHKKFDQPPAAAARFTA